MRSLLTLILRRTGFTARLERFIVELMRHHLQHDFRQHLESTIRRISSQSAREMFWDIARDQKQERVVAHLGQNIKLNCYTDSHLCRLIFTSEFEKSERAFLERYLRPGEVFLDIGANIGLHTVIAGWCVGKAGRVISFEPFRPTFERLLENVALNQLTNVEAHCVALSDRTGKHRMIVSRDGYDAWNSLGDVTIGSDKKSEFVVTITLDDFLERGKNACGIALAKIDVEGWERRVLRGGEKFFSSQCAPTLLVEFTEENARNAMSSCRELYKYLEDLGYSMFAYDESQNSLTLSPIKDEYPYENLIATKDVDRDFQRIEV